MKFKNYIDLIFEKIWYKLHKLNSNKKLPKVILFYGAKYIDKIEFVKKFIKSLFCNKLKLFYEPCDYYCKYCLLNSKNNNLNILNINNFNIKKNILTNNINIDQINLIKKFVNNSNFFNNYKIIFISSIELLNIYSFNSILKLLEEPPKNIYIFMISDSLNKIPLTVLSRCFKIYFNFSKNIYNDFLKSENEIIKYNIHYLLSKSKINNYFFDKIKILKNIINIDNFLNYFQIWLYELMSIIIFKKNYFLTNFKNVLLKLSLKINKNFLYKFYNIICIYKSQNFYKNHNILFFQNLFIEYYKIFK